MDELHFSHVPVLLDACLEGLNIRPDGIYVDGTAGGAGHSRAIAERLDGGRLIALDKDPDAVAVASSRLAPFGCATVVQSEFSELCTVLDKLGIEAVDGILLDLGVSSYQLDTPERGFSYAHDAPLDMRMTKTGLSARDVVNTYSFKDLCRVFRDYGEEKFAPAIAKKYFEIQDAAPNCNNSRIGGNYWRVDSRKGTARRGQPCKARLSSDSH